MSGHPVKMAPELRTSLLTEVVLAALGVAAESAPPVRVETTGPYTATLSIAESNLWYGGLRLALTVCVGGVSQAVVSAVWRPDSSEPLRELRATCMERLAEAIEAEPGVTEAVLDETYKASIFVRLSYGRARIIREGNNG
mgnify:CR=1 FL=1